MPTNALKNQVDGSHYKDMAIQPIEYCQKNKLRACESAVIKYVSRHQDKNGRVDIEKAIHCLQLLLELDYGGDPAPASPLAEPASRADKNMGGKTERLMRHVIESPQIVIRDETERDLLCRSLDILAAGLNRVFAMANFPFRLDLRGVFIELAARTLDDGTLLPPSPVEEGFISVSINVAGSALDTKPLTECKTCKGEGYYFDPSTHRSVGCGDCEAVAILNEREKKFH